MVLDCRYGVFFLVGNVKCEKEFLIMFRILSLHQYKLHDRFHNTMIVYIACVLSFSNYLDRGVLLEDISICE